MKKIIYAQTGEVKSGKKDTILRSSAIGSCLAIAAYDKNIQVGALAHVMLPGKAPEHKKNQKTRYAADALDELIRKMDLLGSKEKNIEVCLAGGANVLKKKDDTINRININSVEEVLKKRKIKVKARSLGGTERRSITLNVETGCVRYTVGNGAEKLLWCFE
ncbi:MAG TPA: hypothetical protein ENL20_04480 [Candidatus Cloacimonetes bacterium]|nr:hypothetical protein [Candidatus Cloacimonadota bacterium]